VTFVRKQARGSGETERTGYPSKFPSLHRLALAFILPVVWTWSRVQGVTEPTIPSTSHDATLATASASQFQLQVFLKQPESPLKWKWAAIFSRYYNEPDTDRTGSACAHRLANRSLIDAYVPYHIVLRSAVAYS